MFLPSGFELTSTTVAPSSLKTIAALLTVAPLAQSKTNLKPEKQSCSAEEIIELTHRESF